MRTRVFYAYYFMIPRFDFFQSFILFLGFRTLLGLDKSFSIASIKSFKLMHFVSFERNNLDVVNFYLGGFGITLILPAVGGLDKI